MSRLSKIAEFAVFMAWGAAIMEAVSRPEPSGWFDYNMAFHEKWYPAVARGEIVDGWLPPGFVWLAPWPGVVALRVVSIAASLGLVALAWHGFGRNVGLLVASTPFLVAYGSRAQPDSLMLLLAFGGVLLGERRGLLGGFLVGVSTFVKPVGVLSGLCKWPPNWKWALGLFLGVVPFLWWLALNLGSVQLHAAKSVPFEDWARMVAYCAIFMAPLLLLRFTVGPWLLSAAIYGVFAFVKAPLAHEYYALPAMVSLALAAKGSQVRFDWAILLNSVLAVFAVWSFGP